MSKKKEELHVTEGNIFADLDIENSEELLARSDLLSEVNRLIKSSKLPQKKIAEILKISQSKVSMLVSGKLSAFSADTLLYYLTLLGCNVVISLKPRSRTSRTMTKGKMTVLQSTTSPRRRKKRFQKA